MDSVFIAILLTAVVVLLAMGLFFVFTSRKEPDSGSGGVKIIGSSKSIVTVKKIDSGDYEIRVEDMEPLDLYDEGEFLFHEESLLDRWMRKDISDEERRLLAEEIREVHGIDLRGSEKNDDAGGQDKVEDGKVPVEQDNGEDVEDEEEVDPQTFVPVRKPVNRFGGYDPFVDDGGDDAVNAGDKALIDFIVDNYRRGLLRPAVMLYARDRLGLPEGQRVTELGTAVKEADADPILGEIMSMPLEEFSTYVHEEVERARSQAESEERQAVKEMERNFAEVKTKEELEHKDDQDDVNGQYLGGSEDVDDNINEGDGVQEDRPVETEITQTKKDRAGKKTPKVIAQDYDFDRLED